MKVQGYNREALQTLDELIENGITVDTVICDPPYGTTACSWDKIIDFNLMWEKLDKIVKPNGAIILFGSQPFTSKLINSNPKLFRYEYIWDKNRSTGFLNAKKMPLKKHENILVFYKKLCTYNPQGIIVMDKPIKRSAKTEKEDSVYAVKHKDYVQTITNYPNSILKFNVVQKGVHPTQKPVELLEFLVKTYSNQGETILDFTAGSFSTAIACIKNNRNFIGIELSEKYFYEGFKRIKEFKNIILEGDFKKYENK